MWMLKLSCHIIQLVLLLLVLFCFVGIETGAHVAQAGFRFTMELIMTLN